MATLWVMSSELAPYHRFELKIQRHQLAHKKIVDWLFAALSPKSRQILPPVCTRERGFEAPSNDDNNYHLCKLSVILAQTELN